jgi:protoporphyrinogen oxidase
MKRRSFFKLSAAALGLQVFYSACKAKIASKLPGKIVGANAKVGHILRGDSLKAKTVNETIELDTLIIGGGISGLTTAYFLNKNNRNNFKLIELENSLGGNSSFGQNDVTKYPWGAHYITMPNKSFKPYIEFLQEHNVILQDGNTINEEYLCFEPEERLYINGKWQTGMVPDFALTDNERNEFKRFFSYINELSNTKSNDGKYIFDIPIAFCATNTSYADLDNISMFDWLQKNGYTSEYIFWYIDYACRDDFGSESKYISAWAAFHYFASRRNKYSNADINDIITWPQGNGWLVEKLQQSVKDNCITGVIATAVSIQKDKYIVTTIETNTNKVIQYSVKQLVVATPLYIANKLFSFNSTLAAQVKNLQAHKPWVVANITLKNITDLKGLDFYWDNVIYKAKSLGFINATHQSVAANTGKTVLTWYYVFGDDKKVENRQYLATLTHQDICALILEELIAVFKIESENIENVDILKWGHGMASPQVGFLTTTKQIKESLLQYKNCYFVHTDVTGISLFEEAFYNGHEAAIKIAQL